MGGFRVSGFGVVVCRASGLWGVKGSKTGLVNGEEWLDDSLECYRSRGFQEFRPSALRFQDTEVAGSLLGTLNPKPYTLHPKP